MSDFLSGTINLTGLTEEERQEIYEREARRGVTYKAQDGSEIHSSEVPSGRDGPLKERCPPPHQAIHSPVITRQPVEKKRGRPNHKRIIEQAWPEPWVRGQVLAELGKTIDEVTVKEFESCLEQVGFEKGWIVEW